jgi:hypothetical protein
VCLQNLATTIKQLAHCAYHALQIQLLLGGEKMVIKALREALEPTSQTPENKGRDILGELVPPTE